MRAADIKTQMKIKVGSALLSLFFEEATRCHFRNTFQSNNSLPSSIELGQHKYLTTMSESDPKTDPPPPFDFTENSKAMYDDTLSSPPFFIRWLVRSKLDAALKARGCGTITEQIMHDACREVTPESQIDKVIEVLDKHKTVK